jgi:hypothetical protein
MSSALIKLVDPEADVSVLLIRACCVHMAGRRAAHNSIGFSELNGEIAPLRSEIGNHQLTLVSVSHNSDSAVGS